MTDPAPPITLTPAAEHVRNPWTVVLKLDRPTLGAYGLLSKALVTAARAANDYAVALAELGQHTHAADQRAVRDALRAASTRAMLGRVGDAGATPCRRCGADCPVCSPQVTE